VVVRGCRVVRQTAQRTTRSLVRQLVSFSRCEFISSLHVRHMCVKFTDINLSGSVAEASRRAQDTLHDELFSSSGCSVHIFRICVIPMWHESGPNTILQMPMGMASAFKKKRGGQAHVKHGERKRKGTTETN